MSKSRVIVLAVVSKTLTPSQAGARYGVTRQWVHELLRRYHAGGLEALAARSKRPRTNPRATSEAIRRRVTELRCELTEQGLDAGPTTIAWHLEREGHAVPSTSTIRRVLHAAGLVRAQPQKRPKSSIIRFEASQPNETWQGDFTHWQLADGGVVEIINWLDDHSRLLLGCRAYGRVGGREVLDTFTACVEEFGAPASTLTDNAVVYTSRFVGGRNAFEYLLVRYGIVQKNGSPSHPQTQGKIERFHQTLKKRLRQLPPAGSLEELQAQLDAFRALYNERRPHRALRRMTPLEAYQATPKAQPAALSDTTHYRIRKDKVDRHGRITLRRAGKLHHLGIGSKHVGKRAIILADAATATVIDEETGEILSEHQIQPAKSYWRNQNRSPGRWPGPPA